MTLAPAGAEKNIRNAMGDDVLARSETMTASSIRQRLVLAGFSGFLLTLAFPRWNLWFLAWVALLPLLYSLDQARNRREAFLLGFAGGFVFFLLSVSWLRQVTVFGMFFVAAMEALSWGVFAALAREKDNREPSLFSSVPPLFVSACWVALEFVRSEIPVGGFGWNLLGNSQASNLWIAQLASLGGVYAVSFLVFLGNTVIYSLLRNGIKAQLPKVLLFPLLAAAAILFGWSRLETFAPNLFLRVSVLQGNIPQLLKWEKSYREEILKIYLNLTELASYDAPQLIVWPEAAYPGFFNREADAERVKEGVRKIEIPLLVGSPHEEEDRFYNSAYLLGRSGEVTGRYDKIRLVPFGEYVPWKPIFGFLEPYAYALGVSDFSAGREFSVFHLEESGIRFSVLVCFEDTFPDLARRFVDRGADFLTVITNDAWFGHTSAPYQHLQASIFRAIENGVPVVRAANTGVSGFITPRGQVVERVKNQEGEDTFVMGGITYPLAFAKETTLYRKGGWLFPYGILGTVLAGTLLLARPVPPRTVPALLVLWFFLGTGCLRLTGGAFYAKKGTEGEPAKVKEVHLDTDEFLPGKKPAPGKIEV